MGEAVTYRTGSRLWALGSLTIAGAVLLVTASACGGSGGGPGATPPGGTGKPPSAKANDIVPTPRDRIRDGGTFTWPLDTMPANFNVNEIDGTDQSGVWVLSALMPNLYTTDAAGSPVWNPDYLASEATLATDPQEVVTYELNPKARWYDGTPITWEDLYWQWKASGGADHAYRISSANGYENIGSVTKGKNDYEAIVTYKTPFADWQALFAPFYPAATNKNPAVFNDGWKETLLTTAGPFRLDAIDRTSQTITLVRNEKWWGNRAKLDRIVFRVIQPDAQIDALANNEIDALDLASDASKYQRARVMPDIDLRVAGGPNFTHLTLNGASPQLQDVRVRRALAMAINRQAIARAMLSPLGMQPTVLNNHIFMENQHGYEDNSGDVGRYDPARSAQLLDEAGWTLDGNVRKKAGDALTIHLVIPAGVQTARQIGELIQNMLAQVGVTVAIETVPSNDFFDKYVRPGQFDFTLFAWMGTPFPVSSVKSIYVNPTRNAEGQLDIQQNYARIGSPGLDALMLRASREFDREKAIALANQADAMIWQEVHSLTLYQRPEIVPTRKGLVNFGAFGFETPWVYQDIGWATP